MKLAFVATLLKGQTQFALSGRTATYHIYIYIYEIGVSSLSKRFRIAILALFETTFTTPWPFRSQEKTH